MMTNKTSKSSHLLKLLALLPIVGVTLALNAETVKDYVYDEPQKQVPVKKGKINGTIKYNSNTTMQVVEAQDQKKEAETPKAEQQKDFKVEGTYTSDEQKEVPQDVFDVVEVMPQFPGGAPKLFEYLSQNIRYPKEAMESNTQGRVIVSFVVCKDGSICDAKVVKSVSPALDAEGLRVISSMPNWTPGTQSGKAVNVKYTVPISFRLDDKAKETPTATGTSTPKVISDKSYKLTENATIKDIVNRLPGAKIDENGNVTVNGKAVKKIMINGKAFEKQDMTKTINLKDINRLELDDLVISVTEK
jgi:TonB family protein